MELSRRKLLQGIAGGAATIAGCSSPGNPNRDKRKNKTDISEVKNEEKGLPDPGRRNYGDIEYELDLPERIERSARFLESQADRLAFDSSIIARDNSYLDISFKGTQSIVAGNDNQVEQDLYGIEIGYQAEEDFNEEEAEDLMSELYKDIIPGLNTKLYDQDTSTPDEIVISDISCTIEGEDSYANTGWSMESRNLEELKEGYLEESLEKTVRNNLVYN